MNRRTFIADASILGLTGELLITMYDEGLTGMTVAYREQTWHTWSPPMIARETT